MEENKRDGVETALTIYRFLVEFLKLVHSLILSSHPVMIDFNITEE
jgi:hypothetical protein